MAVYTIEKMKDKTKTTIMLCYAATTYDMNLSERVRNSMNKLWVEGEIKWVGNENRKYKNASCRKKNIICRTALIYLQRVEEHASMN